MDRASELLLKALHDAGHTTAYHRWTDVGYSAIFIELDTSFLRISDTDCSAHHSVDEHTHPWWAVYQPNPAISTELETLYQGEYGTPIAEDTEACVSVIDRFFDIY